MPKIGCQTITWGPERNRNELAQIMKEIHRAGYTGMEIGFRHLDPTKESLYRDLLAQNGLELVALHVGGNFLDRDSVANQVANIENAMRLAKGLGSEFIFVSGTYKEGKTTEDYRFEAGTYNRIGSRCREYGLTLCYHNHDWEIRSDLQGFMILLQETDPDKVGFVPDVGWVARGGGEPVALVKSLGARCKALHFKDFDTENKFCEVGSGVTNFKGVYELVKDRKDFWIVCEQDETQKTPAESVTINCRYVKRLQV